MRKFNKRHGAYSSKYGVPHYTYVFFLLLVLILLSKTICRLSFSFVLGLFLLSSLGWTNMAEILN